VEEPIGLGGIAHQPDMVERSLDFALEAAT
jgi:hypothetical protein